MELLFDHNLSPRLVNNLADLFPVRNLNIHCDRLLPSDKVKIS